VGLAAEAGAAKAGWFEEDEDEGVKSPWPMEGDALGRLNEAG
jgi:hypothetical protein